MAVHPKLPLKIQARQWLCARTALIPFLPKPRRYALSIGREPAFVWFQIAKVGSRTMLRHLENNGVRFELRQGYEIYFIPRVYRHHFKFAFVRNPWDRLVSCWRNKVIDNKKAHLFGGDQETLQSFEQFVNHISTQDLSTCNSHVRLQCVQIDLNHLDFLGRFERFADDFRVVCGKLGLPGELKQRVNASTRHPDYRIYYTDDLAEKVGALYRRDIDMFGYSFGP